MIVYDLKCSNGHSFEGWFEDSKAYEEQWEKGLITCPECNDSNIMKMPSTFGIKGRAKATEPVLTAESAHFFMRKVAEYVDKNFDDVGPGFATEALKMHYGVKEPRNIRGVSTKAEEEMLDKEGVKFMKMPVSVPPEDIAEPDSELKTDQDTDEDG